MFIIKLTRGDKNMSVSKKIRHLLIERDMTAADLAKKLNTGASNLGQKMKRDNFSENELKEIAEALNCDYEIVFTMKDTGKKV